MEVVFECECGNEIDAGDVKPFCGLCKNCRDAYEERDKELEQMFC